MDYSFYIQDLGEIDSQLVEDLYQHALALPRDLKTTAWNPAYHRGVDGVRMPIGQAPPVIERLLLQPAVSDVFPRESFHLYELSKLNADGVVGMHTDQRHLWQGCMFGHKMHVPLSGSAIYKFKRSATEEPAEFQMQIGHVYVYNNYVLHGTVCTSAVDRYNLVVNFLDMQWTIKKRIYAKFGCDNTW